METMGIVAIVFILVLVFSVVGFTIGFGDKQDNTEQVVDNAPTQTQVIYVAEITGTVKELPTTPGMYKIMGYTNESSIDKIDFEIKSISGVSNLSSKFAMNQDANASTYIYVADVVGYDLNYHFFKETVLNKPFFVQGSQVFPYSKVTFSSKVSFFNKDLNITKEYEFGNPQALVLANADTLQGDTIKFQMNALFIGEAYSKSENYELSNETSSPKAYSFLGSGKFTQDNFIIELPSQIDENQFAFLKPEFDFNYVPQSGNTILKFENNIDAEKVLQKIKVQEFLKDFNLIDANVFGFRIGTTYLDYVKFMDKNIEYKSNVQVVENSSSQGLSFENYKTIPENMEFRFTAYVSRDSVLGIYAEPVSGSQ